MSKSKSNDDHSTTPTIVVLGLDENGKPRGAKFAGGHKDLVLKAAGLMNLEAYEVEAAAADQEVFAKLPTGRLYSNGRGFVPNIRRDRYAKLLEAFGLADKAAEAATKAGVEFKGYPSDWPSIAEGHVLLAQCEDPEDGWFEVIVTKVDSDILTLKWRDYPKYAPFMRHRSAVALLNSNLSSSS